MTGPLAPRVVVAADAADYKKGARLRRGLCRRVVSPQGKRLTMICASLVLLQIMFAVHRFAQGATALRAQILKRRPASFVIRPQRSGVEKSPPLMVQAALRREISRLSVSSERFPRVPIPACGSARDDDPGGQHWTRLRCEGSEGSKGGAIALSGDEFYRPPGEANPFHHWRGPPPPASRGRQVYRGAVPFTPAGAYL